MCGRSSRHAGFRVRENLLIGKKIGRSSIHAGFGG